MLDALIMFAQQPAKQPPAGGQDPFGGLFGLPTLLLAMFALFFIMVIWPNQRREKREREALLNNLKKNDEVLLGSGIIGVVANIKDQEISLKIDDNTRMRVLKSSIVRVLTKEGSSENAEAKKS